MGTKNGRLSYAGQKGRDDRNIHRRGREVEGLGDNGAGIREEENISVHDLDLL